MISIHLQQALDRAKIFDKGLTAYDFTWGNHVLVVHDDGTRLDFNFAFYMKENDWYYIFTEHHGCHVYHEEDVVTVHSYEYQTTD